MSSLIDSRDPENSNLDVNPYIVADRYALSLPIDPATLGAARAHFGFNPDGTRRPTRREAMRAERERIEAVEAERTVQDAVQDAARATPATWEAGDSLMPYTSDDLAYETGFSAGYDDGRFGRLYTTAAPHGMTDSEQRAFIHGYTAGRDRNWRDRTAEIYGTDGEGR